MHSSTRHNSALHQVLCASLDDFPGDILNRQGVEIGHASKVRYATSNAGFGPRSLPQYNPSKALCAFLAHPGGVMGSTVLTGFLKPADVGLDDGFDELLHPQAALLF